MVLLVDRERGTGSSIGSPGPYDRPSICVQQAQGHDQLTADDRVRPSKGQNLSREQGIHVVLRPQASGLVDAEEPHIGALAGDRHDREGTERLSQFIGKPRGHPGTHPLKGGIGKVHHGQSVQPPLTHARVGVGVKGQDAQPPAAAQEQWQRHCAGGPKARATQEPRAS